MKEIVEINKNGIIVESPKLATSVYADSLTKPQLDIIMCLVSMIEKNDDNFHTYIIPTNEILKILRGANPRTDEAKKLLKETIIGLKKASFVIENEDELITFGWIDFARLDKKKETLTIRLSDDVKELYLGLKENGLIYQLENMLSLSTAYQAKLYEWAYSKKNFKNDVSISIEDIKTLFNKKDVRTADFISKYLNPAIKKINEKTDLNLEYEKIKADKENKRLITSLKFKIKCKYQKKPKKERSQSQLESDKNKKMQTWQENIKLHEQCQKLEETIEAQKKIIEKLSDENEVIQENAKLKDENLKLRINKALKIKS